MDVVGGGGGVVEESEEGEEEEEEESRKSKKRKKKAVVMIEGSRSDLGKKRRKITKLKLEDGVRKVLMNSRWHSLTGNVSGLLCV